MPKFTFKGTQKLYYPALGVTVSPGDTVELKSNPGDGNWSAAKKTAEPATTPEPATTAPAPAPADSPKVDA